MTNTATDIRINALEARVAILEDRLRNLKAGEHQSVLLDECARAFGWPGITPHGYSWTDIFQKIRLLMAENHELNERLLKK